LRVFQPDAAVITNVVFKDIRIEEAHHLISLWLGKLPVSPDKEFGKINGVAFEKINATSKSPLDIIEGDATHVIENLTFRNVCINKKPLKPNMIRFNEFTKNVAFVPLVCCSVK